MLNSKQRMTAEVQQKSRNPIAWQPGVTGSVTTVPEKKILAGLRTPSISLSLSPLFSRLNKEILRMNPSFKKRQPWLCHYLEHTPKSVHTIADIRVRTIGQTETLSNTQPRAMDTTAVVQACLTHSYILKEIV